MKPMGYALAAAMLAASTSAYAQPTLPPSDDASGFTLHLICRGTGERKVVTAGTATAFSGGNSATAFGTRQQLSQFGEQLDIDIQAGAGKARVPRRFLPALHGGDGGWFEVRDLNVTPDEITGKIAINFNQHPNLRIDRRSGAVALDGKVGAFAGQCEKIDPTQHAF